MWISWQHYIPAHERREIKKKYGVVVDGFGNVKKKTLEDKTPKNPNDLMYKPKNQKLSITKKDTKKNFKSIDKYKPTGLIYNSSLFETIKDKTSQ